MLSRALILATVMLSVLLAARDVRAQNLEAGKSPSQIFSNSCSACHRSPRGVLKTLPPGSLPGFLRDHYTTSKDMAQQMSSYLLSNGATDPRGGGSRLTKQGQDARFGRQNEPQPAEALTPSRRPRPGQPQEAARPDADGLAQPDPPRAARSKRGRQEQQQAAPGLGSQPAPVEAVKPDAPKPDAADVAPAAMPKPPEPAPVVIDPKVDAPKAEPVRPAEPASQRPDPVPQVTPAPSSQTPSAPAEAPAAASPAPSDAPPKPTISVTPPPPTPPSGPATAPISQ